MEITHPREYKSPRRKLLRFFEKSRDKWKLKYREVKKVLKRLTNRIRFLERSKAEYKQRVEELRVFGNCRGIPNILCCQCAKAS
jgi:flagellar biosynthesis chaperone FliJ